MALQELITVFVCGLILGYAFKSYLVYSSAIYTEAEHG
jgi:hypothetical protein